MKKDMLPLYIAIVSGVFTLLTTVADNLTKNVEIVIEASKSVAKTTKSFDIVPFILKYPKPILCGSISVVAIVVFCVIKFHKHRINKRKK